MSDSVTDRYATDMANGRWKFTHRGLAFNCDGTLLDGQHRLAAIVKSNRQQRMMVTFGLPRESVSVVDDHRKRTAGDSLQIVHGVSGVNLKKAVATAQYLMGNNGRITGTYQSRQAQIDTYTKHEAAIRWALERLNTGIRGLCRAPLSGVIARAYYSQDLNRLSYFCAVILDPTKSNDIKVKDAVISKLRDYLMQGTSCGGTGLAESYRKVACALKAWLDGKSLQRIDETKKELFLLPEEILRLQSE